MDRRPALMGWRQRLDAALRAEDWTALQRTDREIAAGLPGLAAGGAWSANEHEALQQLQRSHERARAVCDAALRTLGSQLERLQSQREGWLAYGGAAYGGAAWEAR